MRFKSIGLILYKDYFSRFNFLCLLGILVFVLAVELGFTVFGAVSFSVFVGVMGSFFSLYRRKTLVFLIILGIVGLNLQFRANLALKQVPKNLQGNVTSVRTKNFEKTLILNSGFKNYLIRITTLKDFEIGESLEILEAQEIKDIDFSYYKSVGVLKELIVEEEKIIKLENDGWVNSLRNKIYDYFNYFPYPNSELLKGLVLGQVDFDRNLHNKISSAGLSHVVAVSGFNILLLINFVEKLRGILGDKVTKLLTISVVNIYGILVGFTNFSAFRALVFGNVLVLGKFSGRKIHFFDTLVNSLIIILMVNPFAVYSVSMWLSASATFGIFYYSDILIEKLWWVPKYLREDFSLTLSATLLTLPIILIVFGKQSLAGLFSNLLIIPVIPILTILAIIGSIGGIWSRFAPLDFVLYILSDFVFWVNELASNIKLSINNYGLEWNILLAIILLLVIPGLLKLNKLKSLYAK